MNNKPAVIWDPLVRFGHWALVFLFAVSWISSESNTDIHTLSGYSLVSLVLLRVVWGFVGSRHARFTDFVRPPSEVIAYASGLFKGQPAHFEGHNPLGGWMIVALLVSLLLTTGTGMLVYGAEGHGPLAGFAAAPLDSSAAAEVAVRPFGDDEAHEHGERYEHDDSDNEDRESEGLLFGVDEDAWEDVHETLANTTLFLVLLHVVGVLVASLVHGENLIGAMLSGRKS